MSESIHQRLDRVLNRIEELGARAEQIVLSKDDLDELSGERAYRSVTVNRGEIGQSSYVEASGGPSGDTNFGV